MAANRKNKPPAKAGTRARSSAPADDATSLKSGSDSSPWAGEFDDLMLIGINLGVVALTWVLCLSWGPRFSIMGNDGLSQIWPFLSYLVEEGGDWSQVAYRAQGFGGVKIHDVVGSQPIHQWLARSGVPVLWCMNLGVMFLQLCFGYFGVKAVSAFASDNGRALPINLPGKIGLVWLFAFSPMLAWRFGMGHLNLVLGLLVFVVAYSVFMILRTQGLTLTTLLISVLALMHGIPSFGQQVIVYSIVFALPLLVCLLFINSHSQSNASRWSPLILTLSVVIVGLLISMPMFAGILDNALGDDFTRALDQESVIYSFTTANVRDWVGSVSWHQLIDSGREPELIHETNYPLGPPLLILVFLGLRKSWGLLAGFLVSLVLVVGFSMNIAPFSTGLPALVPLLDSFRVPARAMIPVQALWLTLSVALLLRASALQIDKRRTNEKPIGVLAAFVGAAAAVVFIFPAPLAELLGWASFGVLIFWVAKRQPISSPVLWGVVLILGATNLSAFKERIPKYIDTSSAELRNERLHRDIIALEPGLASPLQRVQFAIPSIRHNIAMLTGISTIDGYGLPPRRFSELYQALENEEYDPLVSVFGSRHGMVSFPVLQQLYNVVFQVTSPEGTVKLARFPQAPRPFWASRRVSYAGNMKALVGELRSRTQAPGWQNTLVLLANDSRAPKIGDEEFDACGELVLGSDQALTQGQSFTVTVQNSVADCPVTVATNFASNLRVVARLPSGDQALEVYPAYGSLTGFMLPEGATGFVFGGEAYIPGWSRACFWAGLVALFGMGLARVSPNLRSRLARSN